MEVQNQRNYYEKRNLEFDPHFDYRLNIKYVSKNIPESRDRIKFLKDKIVFKKELCEQAGSQYLKGWVDIYVYEERLQLIKEIKEKMEYADQSELFLHGNAGFGKTHLLLDLTARLRFKYLEENYNQKPNYLIFYYMFNILNSSNSIDFKHELYFPCYPLIKYVSFKLQVNLNTSNIDSPPDDK